MQHRCRLNLLLHLLPSLQHQHSLLLQGNGHHLHFHQQASLKVGLKTSGITLVGSMSNQ